MMAGVERTAERPKARTSAPAAAALGRDRRCCRWSTSRSPSSSSASSCASSASIRSHALQLLVVGAFGSPEAIGYTLYYATNFIFTGLAVAVAFHAGLFNIGGEGQAYIGGLGCRRSRCWRSTATCRPG